MYEVRDYREKMKSQDMTNFRVMEFETDLFISAKKDLSKITKKMVKKYREEIINYSAKNIEFYKSLVPIVEKENASKIVKHMIKVSKLTNVGPMAAIAGAISEYVGIELLKYTDEVIIENGGDIFLKTKKERKIKIYAGKSKFSNKLSLKIKPNYEKLGICTSSGTFGHSLSFGKSDAVVVLSEDTLLADATATAIGNIIKTKEDIKKGIKFATSIKNIIGILIIVDNTLGSWGKIEIER
ncbi:thiamine biosynthesis protein ApbE [Tepiditoga spiralis]|uniref:Thiamine biosynthesis protein ApbE n=1 Tax=Tepiditoga spiralis TaxID=2108365 RepID=A0A7G1G608_9BACT|nr:UPF0280 family protein [Tepiditoga spiralis]BBE30277.1 thiamine biosynthesis protein ApbE [Tepiditoga spiralis]